MNISAVITEIDFLTVDFFCMIKHSFFFGGLFKIKTKNQHLCIKTPVKHSK